MDKLEAMRVYCAVIEAGGFASAAERLGVSTSAVSRHVAQLEAHLGVRLLNRTTRRMSATDEGFAYFERCTQLLADLDETEATVAGEALRPRGRLRLTAPVAFSVQRLAPAFAAFAKVYPDLQLDLVLSDHLVDLAEEGLDLAIRVGRVGGDNLVARRIGETQLLIAAAPEYLARAGTPQRPEDLAGHACLTYANAASGSQWVFENAAGETASVRIAGPVNSNNSSVLAEVAAAGGGIVRAPCFVLQSPIGQGRLVRLLPDWGAQRLPIHVVYPSRRHLSTRVRAMAGFLAQWFAGDAGRDEITAS